MTITKCKSYDLIEVVAGLISHDVSLGLVDSFDRQCWLVVVVVVCCCCCCLFVCLLTLSVHAQEGSSSCPVSLSVML